MSKPSESPLRFVVLRHVVGPAFARTDRSHLDWMFERPDADTLMTFSTDLITHWHKAFDLKAVPLPDHRLRYLDYEGPLSGNRGSVTRELAGTFDVVEQTAESAKNLFQVNMRWFEGDQRARVRFQRISPLDDAGNCDTWTVSFVPSLAVG